jgi:signal transduction histidine kinase
VVREAYPEPLAGEVAALLPAQRMVQAPLFVANAPYGALVVTSDDLSPLVATALELFAEMIGKAIENVRLRVERVERERLAALGEAAAVMAHEVRNPVGAIMNALALLEHEDRSAARNRALLTIIGEETARLEQLVTQLLELGRPLLPNTSVCVLEAVSHKALRLLASRGEVGDRVVELPPDAETLVRIDPDLTELALVNVLRNAVQSTRNGSRLRIGIEAMDTVVHWTLDDDGPGIPEAVAHRIGQPFVTTRATGTGMGLAVVRRIMEASGGQFSVARSTLLGGAAVTLEFPRVIR